MKKRTVSDCCENIGYFTRDVKNGENSYPPFGDDHEGSEGIEDVLEKNRERNREHAKRTRLRKKALLESMKDRLLFLQNENATLEQLFEESTTANILLGLGHKEKEKSQNSVACEQQSSLKDVPVVSGGKNKQTKRMKQEPIETSAAFGLKDIYRRRINIVEQLRYNVRIEAAQLQREKYETVSESTTSGSNGSDNMDSQHGATLCSMRYFPSADSDHNIQTHNQRNLSNWTVEIDDADDSSGQHYLDDKETKWDSDTQKKERNKMHARLTRNRKKMFTSKMEETIEVLEKRNAFLHRELRCLLSNMGREESGYDSKEQPQEMNQNSQPLLNSSLVSLNVCSPSLESNLSPLFVVATAAASMHSSLQ
mmetsp:Transcript_14733/g.21896  ORF Transcript_14733/g.21896 Transcript_14733/m.21896 type:complete len:367 (+) Transcript_14733:59-1159(+)|eukprot:CAMPEP_0170074586 /NCGR_PEP_ID=MMETSP0019_2-20121128/11865_1 /TAXON_ID=98059 /ORGANISM="Dinobryon sp., Strain UTEXLB2267" /LENGTH=366 /DNA_ID=CAMNT_0010284987 /DNA_START=83 /DNA_END=1183 /DNA_ORIENTATION=-